MLQSATKTTGHFFPTFYFKTSYLKAFYTCKEYFKLRKYMLLHLKQFSLEFDFNFTRNLTCLIYTYNNLTIHNVGSYIVLTFQKRQNDKHSRKIGFFRLTVVFLCIGEKRENFRYTLSYIYMC